MSEDAAPAGETGFDRMLAFTIPARNVRGRIVRLGPVLETILSAHDYPAPIRNLLAEALLIAALIGSLLKGEGAQLTLQAQSEGGVVELLVCDYREGELRGYVRHDNARLDDLGPAPSLFALFGTGFLAITFDIGSTGQRYQGIVPLEGESLAHACESYFAQSEQVPTLIRLGSQCGRDSGIAGGLLVQHLADGEEGRERLHVRMDHPEWEHVAILAGSVREAELVDPELTLEQLLWRLFHDEDEIRVEAGALLTRGCRCSIEHYRSVLSRFPVEDRAEMRGEDGLVTVDCAFCSKEFKLEI